MTDCCTVVGHPWGGIGQKMLSGQSTPVRIGALAGRQQMKVVFLKSMAFRVNDRR